MERYFNIWRMVCQIEWAVSEGKKAWRNGWDELESLPGGGGLGLGLENLVEFRKKKNSGRLGVCMWVWEIESDGKNDMSKSVKARSSLSWASWNKEFGDKEDQWESKTEKGAQAYFRRSTEGSLILVLDCSHYFWEDKSGSISHKILELEGSWHIIQPFF